MVQQTKRKPKKRRGETRMQSQQAAVVKPRQGLVRHSWVQGAHLLLGHGKGGQEGQPSSSAGLPQP